MYCVSVKNISMHKLIIDCLKVLCCFLLVVCFSGCASISSAGDPADPFEGFNRSVYKFNQAMDASVFNPISKAYQAITPAFVDRGVSNFFSNLNDIIIIFNDILQLKIAQAVSDLSRFIFNSTIGLLGFFDVSTNMGLPKHKEDFGQTLAVWGVPSGPYFVVPLLGPTTLRDATSYGVDGLISPVLSVNDTATRAGLLTLKYVDFKADMLSANHLMAEAALDEYEFSKNAYFEYRQNLIHDRESSLEEFYDFEP